MPVGAWVPRVWAPAGCVHVGPRLQVEREIALHSRLRHRNIVAFHGHFADRDHVYMVLEYCSRQVPRGRGLEGAMPPPVRCAHLWPPPMSVSPYLFLPVTTLGPPVLTLNALVPTCPPRGSLDSPWHTYAHLCPSCTQPCPTCPHLASPGQSCPVPQVRSPWGHSHGAAQSPDVRQAGMPVPEPTWT